MVSFWKIALIISAASLCFQTSLYAKDVTLQWDANTDPDLDHYVVYWGISFDPPYGHNSGNIDKSQTTYTVTGLSDGTNYYFAAKAVDSEGLESDYSNVVDIDHPGGVTAEEGASPPSGTGAGGGGCFIATAAYGSNVNWHVKILSKFRDRRLVTNPIGHSIVDAYYTLSPPLASYLHKHPTARAIVRYALIPITGIAYISLYIHPLVLLCVFALLLLIGACFLKRLDTSS